jgi:hypothetical protein
MPFNGFSGVACIIFFLCTCSVSVEAILHFWKKSTNSLFFSSFILKNVLVHQKVPMLPTKSNCLFVDIGGIVDNHC